MKWPGAEELKLYIAKGMQAIQNSPKPRKLMNKTQLANWEREKSGKLTLCTSILKKINEIENRET